MFSELHRSQDLMTQMSRIREQATESEAVVRDITKDIQTLDLAKKNLTTSMTFLKRLQMLGESARSLSHYISSREAASKRAEPARRPAPRAQVL